MNVRIKGWVEVPEEDQDDSSDVQVRKCPLMEGGSVLFSSFFFLEAFERKKKEFAIAK